LARKTDHKDWPERHFWPERLARK